MNDDYLEYSNDQESFLEEEEKIIAQGCQTAINQYLQKILPFTDKIEALENEINQVDDELKELEKLIQQRKPKGIPMDKYFRQKRIFTAEELYSRKDQELVLFKLKNVQKYRILEEFKKYLEQNRNLQKTGYRSLKLKTGLGDGVVQMIHSLLNGAYFNLELTEFIKHFNDAHILDVTIPAKIYWTGDFSQLRALFDFLTVHKYMVKDKFINKLISMHFQIEGYSEEEFYVQINKGLNARAAYKELMCLTLEDYQKIFDSSLIDEDVELNDNFSREKNAMRNKVRAFRNDGMIRLFYELHSVNKKK